MKAGEVTQTSAGFEQSVETLGVPEISGVQKDECVFDTEGPSEITVTGTGIVATLVGPYRDIVQLGSGTPRAASSSRTSSEMHAIDAARP